MGLLWFVRSTDDLAPACREAGKFLAFRRRGAVQEPGFYAPVFHDPDTGLLFLDEE